jgi:hypothetical protein
MALRELKLVTIEEQTQDLTSWATPGLLFFIINVGVRTGLRAPRLILRALKLTTM